MSNIGSRLDRLPITSLHRRAAAAFAFAYFFELADINTFAFAAPGIVHAWHIANSDIALITSATFGGMFVGAVGGGRIADLAGRKRTFMIAIAIYAISSLLNALSWNIATLAIFRLLTGVGLSGMTVIANTYISEVFPASRRGRYVGLVTTIGLIGIPATAWVARYAVPAAPWGWRIVFVWGSLGIFALLFAARMTESPRWLQHRGMTDRAEDITRRLEEAGLAEHGALPPPEPIQDSAPPVRVPFRRMFEGGQRNRTVMLVIVWIVQTWGFNGFISWTPTLLMEHGVSLVRTLSYASLISICNPLGALIAAALVERVERRWFITVDACVIAICGVLYGATVDPVMIVVFGALVVMSTQAMAVGLYTYTPELFPTDLRSSGMGLTYGVGRLANVLGPFIIGGLFAATGYLSVFVFISGCWLTVGAIIGIYGLSTTGRSLDELNS
jgi:MFS transporter, putative metabolite:H+ symporter